MAATQQMIASLTDKLATLGGKKRGMAIEADDWNALVAVLQGALEIDRTQDDQTNVQLAATYAPVVHQHLSEVSTAWLDADLQAKTAASSGSSNLLLRISQLEAKLTAINQELATLSNRADAQQTTIDRFGVNDLNRSNSIRDFSAKFGTVTGMQTALNAATTDIAGIKTNIQTVLDLRKSLSTPAGAPIDINAMLQDVAGLKTLSANFKGVDGTVLRMSDVELRLKDVEAATGTGAAGGLDGRINAAVSAAEARLKSAQNDAITALHTQLTTEAGQREATSKAALETEMTGKFADAAKANQAALDQSNVQLRGETADNLNKAITAAQQAQSDATKALVAQQMGLVPGIVGGAVASARTDILQAAKDAETPIIASAVQTAVTASEGRMNDRLTTAQTQIQQNLSTLETRLRGEFTASVAASSAQTNSAVNDKFTAMQQTLNTAVATQAKAEVANALPGVTASAQAAVTAGLSTLDAKVAQSVADATKTLPDTVTSQVKTQIAQLNLPAQISTATTQLTQQYKTDIATAISAQQDRTTTAINATLTQLRGEIAVAQKNATNDAINSSNATLAAARNDFTTGIANLRTELNTNLNKAVASNAAGKIITKAPLIP